MSPSVSIVKKREEFLFQWYNECVFLGETCFTKYNPKCFTHNNSIDHCQDNTVSYFWPIKNVKYFEFK